MEKGNTLEQAWAGAVALMLAGLLLAGGTSLPTPSVRLVISLVCIVFTAVAFWRLRAGLPSNLATAGIVLILLMGMLFGLQLLPLPWALVSWLPGRTGFAAAAEDAGVTGSTTLSLSPAMTRDALVATLPGIAMFAAALSVSSSHRQLVAITLVVLAILAALLGIAQRFWSNEALFPYGESATASGFFANRNFFAAQLYTSIPLLGAIALSAVRQQKLPGWLAATFGLAYLCVILGGLAAAESRTGIILSMAAILATAFLPWGTINTIRTRASRRTLLYAVIVFLFVFSQFGLGGLLRFVDADPIGDYRLVIGRLSWQAMMAFFPAGTGFGTFVPVYQMFETPNVLRAEYVNHAHNDWLEIILEGGLTALILLLAFLGWFIAACVRIWARRSDAGGDLVMAASSISVALLLTHSVVDYPLRTPALMGLLGAALGFAAAGFAMRRIAHRPGHQTEAAPVSAGVVRKPFTPFKPAGGQQESAPPGDKL